MYGLFLNLFGNVGITDLFHRPSLYPGVAYGPYRYSAAQNWLVAEAVQGSVTNRVHGSLGHDFSSLNCAVALHSLYEFLSQESLWSDKQHDNYY